MPIAARIPSRPWRKAQPYGFIRITVGVVNISAVEEIQPLLRRVQLRVKVERIFGKRTYKDNLRDLAQLWVGSERLCG